MYLIVFANAFQIPTKFQIQIYAFWDFQFSYKYRPNFYIKIQLHILTHPCSVVPMIDIHGEAEQVGSVKCGTGVLGRKSRVHTSDPVLQLFTYMAKAQVGVMEWEYDRQYNVTTTWMRCVNVSVSVSVNVLAFLQNAISEKGISLDALEEDVLGTAKERQPKGPPTNTT